MFCDYLFKGFKVLVMSNLGEENKSMPRPVATVDVDALNTRMQHLNGLTDVGQYPENAEFLSHACSKRMNLNLIGLLLI